MSGMGQYHGRAGFDRLSHLKSVMKRGLIPEMPVRFPPYSALKKRLLKWLA
jgi:aldehyde dehydrogenase (NAD+)